MKGVVYVFLRKDGAPLPPGCAGHVAWGFMHPEGVSFVGGSTENTGGGPYVAPNGDNGFWMKTFTSEAKLLQAMQARNYDGYKLATVRDPNLNDAVSVANDIRGRGYTALGNNCLDHVYDVMDAYGVKDLPWKQTHPSPNDWFAHFNGEYHNL